MNVYKSIVLLLYLTEMSDTVDTHNIWSYKFKQDFFNLQFYIVYWSLFHVGLGKGKGKSHLTTILLHTHIHRHTHCLQVCQVCFLFQVESSMGSWCWERSRTFPQVPTTNPKYPSLCRSVEKCDYEHLPQQGTKHTRCVACKRSRSFCLKCRWQVTAKHTYTLRMWLCMKWHGAWLYGVHRTCAETAAVSCGTSHASIKYTTSVDIKKMHCRKASHSCRITCKCSKSAQESGE